MNAKTMVKPEDQLNLTEGVSLYPHQKSDTFNQPAVFYLPLHYYLHLLCVIRYNIQEGKTT